MDATLDALGEDENAEFNRRQREFSEFLEQSAPMQKAIEDMLRAGSKRLTIDIDALRAFKADLTAALLSAPLDHVPPFEKAVREYVDNVNPSFGKEVRYRVAPAARRFPSLPLTRSIYSFPLAVTRRPRPRTPLMCTSVSRVLSDGTMSRRAG